MLLNYVSILFPHAYQDSNEEKRVHPRDKDNAAYSYADFLKFYGETGFDQVLASLVLASQPYFKDAAVDF